MLRSKLSGGAKRAAGNKTPESTVVTPFLPIADEDKAGRKGLVSMAHLAAARGDLDKLASLLKAGFPTDELSGALRRRSLIADVDRRRLESCALCSSERAARRARASRR